MARLARVVIPSVAHHITQRGNRRQDVFFGEENYLAYVHLVAEYCREYGVEIWAWCLMPNHIHLIAVPSSEDGLHKVFGESHRRYTGFINKREGWSGYLWQGRFSSFPMDDPHLFAAMAYVELNPVRAGLARRPEDWKWSSARAHLKGVDDPLMAPERPRIFSGIKDWRRFLKERDDLAVQTEIEKHTRTGRPLGSASFLEDLEKATGRKLQKQKPGPRASQ